MQQTAVEVRRHEASLLEIGKRLEKAELRVRVMRQELHRPLQQVLEETAGQAESTALLASKVEALEAEVAATQALIAALQQVAARQVEMLVKLANSNQKQ